MIDNRQTRRFAIALRAFNLEIAQIRDQAHSENTPALRFAFWDEALDRMFNRQSIITPAEVVAYELNQVEIDFERMKSFFSIVNLSLTSSHFFLLLLLLLLISVFKR